MGVRDTIAKALIRAFHGSPHSFDKFDPAKIGTGEGAQMFGHGLYFAEHEPVARGYRERLAGESTPWSMKFGGKDAYKDRSAFDEQTIQGLNELHARMGIYKNPADPLIAERLRKELAQTIENYQTGAIGMDKYRLSDAQAAHRVLSDPSFQVTPAVTPGHMYEVNINADPSHMLDWDKTLREQPQVLERLPPAFLDAAKQEAYSRAIASTNKSRADQLWGIVKDPTLAQGSFVKEVPRETFAVRPYPGETFQASPASTFEDALSSVGGDASMVRRIKTHDPAYVSQTLNDRGIPGIKYLDAGSRGTGEGSSNYVIFPGSVDKIDILRKFALPTAIAAPPVIGSLYDQSQYQGVQP